MAEKIKKMRKSKMKPDSKKKSSPRKPQDNPKKRSKHSGRKTSGKASTAQKPSGSDTRKTKAQLIYELVYLRQRIAEIEGSSPGSDRVFPGSQYSEDRFKEVFHRSNDAFWLWELDASGMPQRLIDVNNRATEMLGYTKEELYKFTPKDFVAPEFKPMMAPIVKEIQTKGRATYEMLHIRKDNQRLPVEVSSHTFYLENEKVTLSVVRDITRRKRAEEALRKANEELERRVKERTAELLESKDRYRQLFNSGQDYILVHSYRADQPSTFFEVNDRACKVLGYTREEFLNMTPFDIDSPESVTDAQAVIKQLMDKGHALFEQIHLTKDGRSIPVEINTHIFIFDGDKVALSICRDITKRKEAERSIKASLKEKEVLLQEIHHRVKNNLAIIMSLLRLQSRFIDNEEIREVLLESQNRIKTMSLIHEKLYLEGNLLQIDFEKYVNMLLTDLFDSYKIGRSRVKKSISIDKISINIDTMIPCGLIINELVTNSLKYAFNNVESPEIWISLRAQDDGMLTLVIGDNGTGIPEGIDIFNHSSLGIQIVEGLVDQLGGKMELDRSVGTEFSISFKPTMKSDV